MAGACDVDRYPTAKPAETSAASQIALVCRAFRQFRTGQGGFGAAFG
jgi:hypothetical protein